MCVFIHETKTCLQGLSLVNEDENFIHSHIMYLNHERVFSNKQTSSNKFNTSKPFPPFFHLLFSSPFATSASATLSGLLALPNVPLPP